MKLKNSILLTLLLVLTSAFTVETYLSKNSTPPTEETNSPKKWTDVETAINMAKSDQKKILLDVYTDWCKWCKVMDQKTFTDPKLSTYLSSHFHLAKFNAEQKQSILFNGKKYSFSKNGKRGYHEFAAEILNGQLAYPSLVVFDSELNKLEVIRGYKSAPELMKILTNLTDS